MKLYVYRRIANYIKEHYPNSPLFVASWDLWMRFTPDEVKDLVAELDPSQSIILDYTSDTPYHNNFTNWNLKENFPWIFGIFSGYEWQSEIRGFYELTNERLQLAKEDSACKGVILWPELSHGDPLVFEYLARNAWEKETLSIPEFVDKFCADRYGENSVAEMTAIWQGAMPIITAAAWSMYTEGLWECGTPLRNPIKDIAFDQNRLASYKKYLANRPEYKDLAAELLLKLSKVESADSQQTRDLYDLARTILERYISAAIWQVQILYIEGASFESISELMALTEELLKTLSNLLSTHEDYSLYTSLESLKKVTETNPNFETTLKNNASCNYCRSFIYENAEYLYVPEMKAVFEEAKRALANKSAIDRDAIKKRGEEITKNYMSLSLKAMQDAKKEHTFAEVCETASTLIKKMQI
jgi:hypothetical protein